jgi:hypothetical protein
LDSSSDGGQQPKKYIPRVGGPETPIFARPIVSNTRRQQQQQSTPIAGRVPPPSNLDRNDLKRISLRSRAFLLSVLKQHLTFYEFVPIQGQGDNLFGGKSVPNICWNFLVFKYLETLNKKVKSLLN